MITAVLNGTIDEVAYIEDPIFGLSIPTTCPGVPEEVLDPRNTWEDKEAYDRTALNLAEHFVDNFKKFTGVSESIIQAGPKVK